MDYYKKTMDHYADMTCILKVNINCWECKVKIKEVLQNIHGVYSIIIDAEKGTARVTGKVDPNMLLMVLAKSGNHAEILWVQLDQNKGYHNNDTKYLSYGNNNENNYLSYGNNYADQYSQRALQDSQWYNNGNNTYYNNGNYKALPEASYFPQASNHVDQDNPICCSVM